MYLASQFVTGQRDGARIQVLGMERALVSDVKVVLEVNGPKLAKSVQINGQEPERSNVAADLGHRATDIFWAFLC